MALTPAQRTTLATALRASTDPVIQGYVAARNDDALTTYINGALVPNVKAWRESVPEQEADEATPWPSFDTLDATAAGGKKLSWTQFFRYPRNWSKASTRKWITDVWGNATAGSNAESLLTGAGLENLSIFESYYSTSDATTGTVTAKKRTVLGPVSLQDVSLALNG